MDKQAPKLDHLYRLTDDIGLYQHAHGAEPNPAFGYCLDDTARALVVAIRAHALTEDPRLTSYIERYLAFVERAQRPDGAFRNFMGADGAWLEDVGSDDSNGRAVWALGFAAHHGPSPDARLRSLHALTLATTAVKAHRFLRAKAFSLVGLQHWLAVEPSPAADELADTSVRNLCQEFSRHAGPGWRWFEDELTYCNAALCEALIGTAGQEVGLESLLWLCQTLEQDGVISLVGNDGWYLRGGRRAIFDQQAVDAAAVSSACIAAFRATGDHRFERWGRMAYGWFLGENVIRRRMVDDVTGGCYDGLQPSGPNLNQGAESLLAWLSAQEDMLELGWLDA